MTPPSPQRVEAHLLEHVTGAVRARAGSPHPSHAGGVHDALRLRLRSAVRAAAADGGGVALHAAACDAGDGVGLLLPGRSRSGKSTLVLAVAIERGAVIVSDDVVRVDGGRAYGAGAPVSVRRDSPFWDAAQRLWYAEDGERMLVRPDDVGAAAPAWTTDVGIVVFPSYGSPSGLQPLTAAAAFCRLASCLIGGAPEAELMALAALAADVPAYVAGYGNLGEALALVDEAIARGPVAEHASRPTALSAEETSGFTAEIMGIRFGDEVAAFNGAYGEVVHFSEWPEGWAPSVPSWGALVGRQTDVRG